MVPALQRADALVIQRVEHSAPPENYTGGLRSDRDNALILGYRCGCWGLYRRVAGRGSRMPALDAVSRVRRQLGLAVSARLPETGTAG
jgi:hypothetical protein